MSCCASTTTKVESSDMPTTTLLETTSKSCCCRTAPTDESASGGASACTCGQACLCVAPNRTRRQARVAPFVASLYRILSLIDERNVVEWLPGSLNRFVIHDVAQFCEAVLPRFFQHANWTSFTRQLANYSFVHVRDTDDAWVFEHPHFSRDAPATLPLVVRRKSNQANANNDVADTSDDAAATTATATASSSIVTRKRAFEKSLAVETDDDRVHSLEMIAQHGALLKSLHEKLDAQLAGQERVLQNQARIVELLEAQERRQLMRTLEGTASSLFSSTRLASTTSLFDLDSDAGAFCPIHNHS